MNTTTFSALTTAVKGRCFPFGTPENIEGVITNLITEALVLVQRYVPCFREGHRDVFETTANIFNSCSVSTIPHPGGQIHRISNRLKDDDMSDSGTDEASEQDDCDVFVYTPVGRSEIDRCMDELHGLDLSGCRLRWGNYCSVSGKIALVPAVRDSEQVEVEWSGIKRSYSDSDKVPDDVELFAAVCAYVLAEVARRYDKDMDAFKLESDNWQSKIAELIHDSNHEGRVYLPPKDEDMVPGVTFSFTADHGYTTDMDDANAVARLIHSWNPDVMLFGGDNCYPNGQHELLDTAWAPYKDDIMQSRVFPALGNHDVETEQGKPQLAYFSLPGNGRYYNFVRGPVEFFFVNSDTRDPLTAYEPDGIDPSSVQAQWLQDALAASEAKWKVVIVHAAPYTSDSLYTPGNTTMQWPYATWGADLVLSGNSHNYERLIVDDIPFVVSGTGGVPLRAFGATATGSVVRYGAKHGAVKITADRQKMLIKFYTVDNELKDIYAINA